MGSFKKDKLKLGGRGGAGGGGSWQFNTECHSGGGGVLKDSM
jgi:hypothetical protein